MSLRAIARMKRENRELHAKLASAQRVEQRTYLTRYTGLARMAREIQTARRLGFTIECAEDGDDVAITAVKRGPV